MHEDLKSLKKLGGRVGEVLWVAKETLETVGLEFGMVCV